MTRINMPAFLHEVFGQQQSLLELVTTLVFALFGTLMIYWQLYPSATAAASWQLWLGFVIIADVLAGCIANFSRGTNDYYASRARGRLVFIAIHLHILAIAWLLNAPLMAATVVWAYTIAAALVVNALNGHPLQLFIGATLLCCGLFLLVLLGLPSWFLLTSCLFMLKVMFSFAVNHYAK